MVAPYQIHAVLQILAFLFLLVAVYYAKAHNMEMHHRFIYIAVGLMTIAVIYMVYTTGGIPSLHGRIGVGVYLYVLVTAFSGKLFLRGKIARRQHRALAIGALILLALQILSALYTFVF
ncbi:hypothetical protein PAP_02645 [Palaeococcus pacificus DY20341]|uniref:Cytochrome b561 domain-containing protein n=1 Tax=Palaeococcus pacificus DY20341 TaxID=1343739 RepID=A0A075LSL6_9EURY|nr:hypothetical protein [Palaeococcus pacificus]AIF68957.1 hypothetical protein PAP_02645 [Palaeococcus pacificus DY20341]